MILNLSKKTIISSKPLYRIAGRVSGFAFLLRDCFNKYDAVIIQGCRILCRMAMNEADILLINADNSIKEIDRSSRKFLIMAGQSGKIVLLPKGNVCCTNTEKGDVLDLNAELTLAQKKSFLKMPEIAVPLPGTIAMTDEKR